MPLKFTKYCAHAGCKNYALPGSKYCEQHKADDIQRKAYADRQRLSPQERGYTNAWRKASKAFLVAHPLCAECLKLGITKPATEVDHIIPHKGNKDLFWNQNNWQSLCHECHSRKTVKEDGGFGNKIKRKHPRGS